MFGRVFDPCDIEIYHKGVVETLPDVTNKITIKM